MLHDVQIMMWILPTVLVVLYRPLQTSTKKCLSVQGSVYGTLIIDDFFFVLSGCFQLPGGRMLHSFPQLPGESLQDDFRNIAASKNYHHIFAAFI